MKEINKSAELALKDIMDLIKGVQTLQTYPESTHWASHKAKEIFNRKKRETIEELSELIPDVVNNLIIDVPNR